MIDLRKDLPRLLPKAVDWAERQQANILTTGIPLSAEQIVIARGGGAAEPEKIRIKVAVTMVASDPKRLLTMRSSGRLLAAADFGRSALIKICLLLQIMIKYI